MTENTCKLADVLVEELGWFLQKKGVRFVIKESSRLMRFLAFVLFFNKNFMSYTTVIGSTIYLPAQLSPSARWLTYCHEYIHFSDWKRSGWWFTFSYMFPQILALGVLGVFFSAWFLLFLLFLLPLPAPFRAKWEFRAYGISLVAPRWANFSPRSVDSVVSQFAGWGYYKMWPFEGRVRRVLSSWQRRENRAIFEEVPAARELSGVITAVLGRGNG